MKPPWLGPSKGRMIGIYHVVYEEEGFEQSAQTLFRLVKDAAKRFPGQQRALFLDVEGHRNEKGGFDADMYELQTHFLMKTLLPYLAEATVPLAKMTNPNGQSDDVPDHLDIQPEGAAGSGAAKGN